MDNFYETILIALERNKNRYLIFILVLQSQNCHIVVFKGGLDTEGIWFDFLYAGFWSIAIVTNFSVSFQSNCLKIPFLNEKYILTT